MTDHMD